MTDSIQTLRRPSFSLTTIFLILSAAGFVSWWCFMPTDATKLQDMRIWLCEQETAVRSFTCMLPDATPTTNTDAPALRSAWFGSDYYRLNGYQFESIAEDGAGGHYLAWHGAKAAGDDLPLVFIGGGGDFCVLCRSLWNWPHVMAHGVSMNEYDACYREEPFRGPAAVDPTDNEYLGTKLPGSPDEFALREFETYRAAVVKKYGPIPPLSELLDGREELSKELYDWIHGSEK